MRGPGIEVELEPRGPRVAVARLTDGAGVQEPPAGLVQRELGALGGNRAVQLAVRQRDGESDMTVSDEHERRDRQLECRQRRLLADHVLPDRITRARVEELGAVDLRLRLEALEVGTVLVEEHGPRPRRDSRSVGTELLEVEAPEDPEIVVADEAELRPLADDLDHLVRARAVTDEVSEAPELVRGVGVDRFEDSLEPV